ncbi:YheC/YheD family protein [Kyrpidia sp.]|uniref:YheC/YheD family endospore coat-associated protein n=1 Tax=Kyrpidia sp. TaxID=2073077 RepID=UPI0025843313|nr:YheC/YheD family protein [Kyrpidia sp.]MCL6574657.1 YheC/YheD family protein [Kyrpidia sp.]
MVEGPLRIESLVHTRDVIYAAAPLLRRYGMQQGSSVQIRAGLGPVCTVQIRSHILDPNILLMARPVLRRLGLQRGDRIHAKWGGTQLELGPVVALWLPVRRRSPTPAFGAQTAWARDALVGARDMGVLAYVLDPQSSPDSLRAWGWSSKNGWIRRPGPMPDALWRRGERLGPPRGLREAKETGLLNLAPDIGDKWRITKFLLLQGFGDHIPWTRPMSLRRAEAALLRFGRVYAKPRRGSGGRDLLLLERRGETIRWCRFDPSPAQGMWTIPLRLSDWHRVAGHRAYIVQEARIPLTAFGRPVDFRWFVQRGGSGAWDVTAVVARLAPEEDGPTNVSLGGKVLPVDEILQDGERERGTALALSVAEAVGELFPHLVELGMDLLLDKSGEWWILDVNPRPGRSTLKQIDPALRQLSIRKPFEYVKYATGYMTADLAEERTGPSEE